MRTGTEKSMVRIMKQIVTVWNKRYEISVYQKSKSVWIAVGEYMGERIEGQGRTAMGATASWHERARYKGN
jgi:hypothetical protein